MKAAYFDAHFNDIKNNIEFSETWCNGTGYFDGAVRQVKLAPGEQAVSVDTHGRKIIFTGTRFGTVVIFERYVRDENSNGEETIRVVSNTPREVRRLITDGACLGYDEFCRVVGRPLLSNFGKALEELFQDSE